MNGQTQVQGNGKDKTNGVLSLLLPCSVVAAPLFVEEERS